MNGACPCCGAPQISLHAADAQPFDVAPREAIDFLRQKLRLPTATWTDIWQQMHSAAFVVAGAQGDALLKDFHDAVLKAIEQGETLETFREDFDTIVKRYGWSYNGSREWRSKIIFQTNLRMAYAAGRWQQIERVKQTRPYLRYVHLDPQAHPRPLHQSWHNTVLPVDDPWWQTHFPPNGWNCHCTAQSLNERDLERYGLTVTAQAPPINWIDRVVGSGDSRRAIKVPEGIDPGFAYRPGAPLDEAIRQGLAQRAASGPPPA